MPTGSPRPDLSRHLHELLAPIVAASGIELDDVSVSPVGRRNLVRVIVDADGGVDLDGIAAASRLISDTIDADAAGSSAFATPYVLEVSSPGVDRPLKEPKHWRRAIGRLVTTTVKDKSVTGRIDSVDSDGVVIVVDAVARPVAWHELGAGKVQVEFSRPAALGSPGLHDEQTGDELAGDEFDDETDDELDDLEGE